MARRGFDPIPLIVIGGFTWLGLNGNLGEGIQQGLAVLFNSFWQCKVKPSGTVSDYVRKTNNRDAERQMWQWKAQRIAHFENPKDWDAFRAHLTAINAPDPGPTPWVEFC